MQSRDASNWRFNTKADAMILKRSSVAGWFFWFHMYTRLRHRTSQSMQRAHRGLVGRARKHQALDAESDFCPACAMRA